MKEFYVCKRLKLYDYLVQHGFMPCEQRADKYNAKYLVWIFKNSKELQNTVNTYYNEI